MDTLHFGQGQASAYQVIRSRTWLRLRVAAGIAGRPGHIRMEHRNMLNINLRKKLFREGYKRVLPGLEGRAFTISRRHAEITTCLR